MSLRDAFSRCVPFQFPTLVDIMKQTLIKIKRFWYAECTYIKTLCNWCDTERNINMRDDLHWFNRMWASIGRIIMSDGYRIMSMCFFNRPLSFVSPFLWSRNCTKQRIPIILLMSKFSEQRIWCDSIHIAFMNDHKLD